MTSRRLLSFVAPWALLSALLSAPLWGVIPQAIPAPQAPENSVDGAELRAGIEREKDIPLPA